MWCWSPLLCAFHCNFLVRTAYALTDPYHSGPSLRLICFRNCGCLSSKILSENVPLIVYIWTEEFRNTAKRPLTHTNILFFYLREFIKRRDDHQCFVLFWAKRVKHKLTCRVIIRLEIGNEVRILLFHCEIRVEKDDGWSLKKVDERWKCSIPWGNRK